MFKLARRSRGKMSHARWLSKANWILGLYISTISKFEAFSKIRCESIFSKVVWKLNSPIFQGWGKEFFQIGYFITLSSNNFKTCNWSCYRKKSNFENLLLSMLTDYEQNVREFAVQKIMTVLKNSSPIQLCAFELPKINVNARNCKELIMCQMIKS